MLVNGISVIRRKKMKQIIDEEKLDKKIKVVETIMLTAILIMVFMTGNLISIIIGVVFYLVLMNDIRKY